MLTLRAYLKAKMITQTDFDAQRDVVGAARARLHARPTSVGASSSQMLHALRGGADYGYQGTNFVHSNEFIPIPSKKKNKG